MRTYFSINYNLIVLESHKDTVHPQRDLVQIFIDWKISNPIHTNIFTDKDARNKLALSS